MFGGKQNINKVDTIIGPGTEFIGDIKATGIVRIDGSHQGKIETMGDVIVGEKGNVAAEIRGRNISIAGKVEGPVVAEGRLQILPKGVLIGDVEVSTIIIEEGGKYNGQCLMKSLEEHGLKSSKTEADTRNK
ncbi:polymer-forming cytoskeletal protein [Microaerobacter geothermalis]|uniref:bactofilin family protein n=1 Tax=Microaerobacter geothermalis TaxID=674972 RepID=UPI001F3E9DB2|nr:polymer-forming cytoskeletal protein [Microaerobacter geothermalis]MCF6094667.1 polymer-forming cytoskeletal protein [Microaerobacter geothermalis]